MDSTQQSQENFSIYRHSTHGTLCAIMSNRNLYFCVAFEFHKFKNDPQFFILGPNLLHVYSYVLIN